MNWFALIKIYSIILGWIPSFIGGWYAYKIGEMVFSYALIGVGTLDLVFCVGMYLALRNFKM